MLDLGNTDAIVAWAGAHGALALGVVAFLCALGLPLPITVLLLAYAALSRDGSVNVWPAIVACFAGSLLAESMHYALGAGAGPWLRDRTRGRLRGAWDQAETRFHQNAAMTVFLSRHVLAALGLPVNWIAGSSAYPFSRFFFWSVMGNATWIFAFALTGFWLGDSWRRYEAELTGSRTLIVVITLAIVALYLVSRRLLARSRRADVLPSLPAVADAEAGE